MGFRLRELLSGAPPPASGAAVQAQLGGVGAAAGGPGGMSPGALQQQRVDEFLRKYEQLQQEGQTLGQALPDRSDAPYKRRYFELLRTERAKRGQ